MSPTAPQGKTAIIYVRVSSDEQVKNNSLQVQEADCRRFGEERGLSVLQVFREEGESAKFANRPELLRLLEFCRTKRVDLLVIWKVDRLARDTSDYYAIRKKLLGYGVTIQVVTEPVDQTPMGRAVEGMLAVFAELDNAIKAERARANMQALLHKGIWPWRPPPGYLSQHNKKHGRKKTEPDPPDSKRFPVLQRALREYGTGLYSLVETAARLNASGYRTPGGKKLYPQFADRLVQNKFYAGILVDPWTGEDIPGKHEPMIALDEYFQNQRIRQGKANPTPIRLVLHPDFPLRRFVRCDTCDHPLTGSWSRGRSRRYAYYHCRTRSCSDYGKAIAKLTPELEFFKAMERIAPREEAIALFQEVVLALWRRKRESRKDQLRRNEVELERLKEEKTRRIEMRARGELTTEEFLEEKRRLDERLVVTQRGLEDAKRDETDVESLVAFAIPFLREPAQRWDELSAPQKQRFQQLVFPSGIPFSRTSGFGTARLGPAFKLFEGFPTEKSQLVPLVCESWNRLFETLREFQELRGLSAARAA